MRIKLYRGWYYAVWTQRGRTRRAALRTKDRGEAERRLLDLRRPEPGSTVGPIFQSYVRDLFLRGKSPARAEDAWKALKTSFEALRPDQVTREQCRAYTLSRRQQGVGNGTIGRELSTLRAALRHATPNTPAKIELPPRPAPKDRRLSRSEYSRLRLAAKITPHIYVFVVLGLATAGRKQAILDLTWDRVDFERGIIRLQTDGQGKGRATVPMTRHARRTLAVAKKLALTNYVIEYGGRRVDSIKRGFAAACERAGLEGVTPHVLRHTAAVRMAERGIPMSEIAQFLGHSDDRITQRVYAKFSPAYLRRAAAALD